MTCTQPSGPGPRPTATSTSGSRCSTPWVSIPWRPAAFTLSTDFEGDQWTFFKFPPEDLRALFGLEVAELNVWRPVLDHVDEQLELGRLLTIEVDAWFLPDTQGVSYRLAHVKTAMVPNFIDPARRQLGYFHNAGYFELEGDDFDGVFRLGPHADPIALPPYIETIRLDRIRRDPSDLVAGAMALTKAHLARRPADDPMARFGQRLERDAAWLETRTSRPSTCTPSGRAGSAVPAPSWRHRSWTGWPRTTLPATGFDDLVVVADAFRRVATAAKALQFNLARRSRGRTVDLRGSFGEMSEAYHCAMDGLVIRYIG